MDTGQEKTLNMYYGNRPGSQPGLWVTVHVKQRGLWKRRQRKSCWHVLGTSSVHWGVNLLNPCETVVNLTFQEKKFRAYQGDEIYTTTCYNLLTQ